MSGTVCVLQTGDLHVDTCHHGRINPATGIDTAMESNIAVVKHLVAQAIERRVTVFAISGDAFSTGRPAAQAILMLDDALAPLARAGIPILWTEGNHERLGVAYSGTATPLNLMGRLGQVDPVTQVELRHFPGVDILAVPYPSKPRILAALGHSSVEPGRGDAVVIAHVMDTITDLVTARRDLTIPLMLTGHFTVDGIGLPGSEMEVANLFAEPVFTADKLTELGFDYIGLSHIHTPQTVSGIHYAGSPNRLTLTDADDVKSANLVTFGDGAPVVDRVVTPTRGIFVLRLDGDTPPVFAAAQDDVFQIVLEEGQTQVPTQIREELHSVGARYVIKRTPAAQKITATRAVLDQGTSPRDAVSAYLAGAGHRPSDITRQLALADKIGAGL